MKNRASVLLSSKLEQFKGCKTSSTLDVFHCLLTSSNFIVKGHMDIIIYRVALDFHRLASDTTKLFIFPKF